MKNLHIAYVFATFERCVVNISHVVVSDTDGLTSDNFVDLKADMADAIVSQYCNKYKQYGELKTRSDAILYPLPSEGVRLIDFIFTNVVELRVITREVECTNLDAFGWTNLIKTLIPHPSYTLQGIVAYKPTPEVDLSVN